MYETCTLDMCGEKTIFCQKVKVNAFLRFYVNSTNQTILVKVFGTTLKQRIRCNMCSAFQVLCKSLLDARYEHLLVLNHNVYPQSVTQNIYLTVNGVCL